MTRQQGKAASASGFLVVAGAAALWGSDALFRRGLALELPAATVVFVEHAILVLLTLPLLVRGVRATRSFSIRDWVALTIIGVGASATATILFTQAFAYESPTTPLLLQKLQPVIAIAGARLLLGERLLPRYALYFFAALTGAYLISFPDPWAVSVDALVPALLAIGAAVLWGLGTVLGRHLSVKIDFTSLTALRFAVGLPAAAVILLVQGATSTLSILDGSSLLALVLLALVPGLVALLLYYRGLRQTPAAAATLAELAFPLSAITVNYLAFGTTLAATQWLGMVILLATITIMGLRSARGSEAVGIDLASGTVSPQAATP
jgi:DME family drug/metabolite transporter